MNVTPSAPAMPVPAPRVSVPPNGLTTIPTAQDGSMVTEAEGLSGVAPEDSEPEWATIRFNTIERSILDVQRTVAITWNRQLKHGSPIAFLEVPFVNGKIPSAEPNPLPALVNEDVIDALNDDEASSYCLGHYPDQAPPHLVADRKQKIKNTIGCLRTYI